MGRKLFPSSNGFEFLEQYLTKIYGERGSIKHNLIRYINSLCSLTARNGYEVIFQLQQH